MSCPYELLMPTLVLASSSPRRRELLGSLGIPFTIIKPDIDESQHLDEAPLDYVRRLSQEKARAVAKLVPSSEFRVPSEKSDVIAHAHLSQVDEQRQIILAADTVVILGADTLGVDEYGDILGKPVDTDDARDMLRRLRGRTHQVCTALTLCLVGVQSHPPLQCHTQVTRTNVTMRDYSDAEIDAYIATGDPFDKAGSYAIQHPLFRPVARIDGCYTNVVGLPLCTLKNMLAGIGWPGVEAGEKCDCDENLLSS